MIAVYLEMPSDYFQPGDVCYLKTYLENTGPSLEEAALFIFLDFEGTYWFWPSWAMSPDIDYLFVAVPSGRTRIQPDPIPEFTWPDEHSTGEELRFWGALVDLEEETIIGCYDCLTFGYGF